MSAQAEIQNNLNTELSGLESGLVAYYKLDDIETACDVEDCSVNENHGTGINIATQLIHHLTLTTNQPT